MLAIAAYVVLHRLGLAVPIPMWVFPAILGVAFLAGKRAEARWGRAGSGWSLYLWVGVAGPAAATYTTG